jgi:methylphosphotriester-DNA--protein-cysteine methyltransferase
MNITFKKQQGNPSLGIAFFWKMEIETKSPVTITDHFIPELFFDYFFIKKGKVKCKGKSLDTHYPLPRQTLKTIHTHPLLFVFSTPIVLFGARFSLQFAESFWGDDIQSNSFLEQKWVSKNTNDLDSFASQATEYIQKHQVRKQPYPMLSSSLEESSWLVNFSARHKRRLYKTTFGLSKQEIQNIRNLHSFLDQTCDFASQNPRIIQHVNPEVFYDQPHLNHTFKKMTGFSLVEYFQANSILQDHLMSASYNQISTRKGKL